MSSGGDDGTRGGSELAGDGRRVWLAFSGGVIVASLDRPLAVELCWVTGVGRYASLTGVTLDWGWDSLSERRGFF